MIEWKRKYIELIKNKYHNKPLIFIHTPKCGGSYTTSILNKLGIKSKGHKRAIKNEGINFTIIRDPIERFESLLNYRLGEDSPRKDWPKYLNYAYNNTNITLNEIVEKMKDEDIIGFIPYYNLIYWSKNINIFLKIDELKEFLEIFGYKYDEAEYNIINVSKKIRGKLNDENKNKIAKLYKHDIKFFNIWTWADNSKELV